ncbi:MAG: hypothetical protein V2A66_04565 [Pseudomonadota bacterium]
MQSGGNTKICGKLTDAGDAGACMKSFASCDELSGNQKADCLENIGSCVDQYSAGKTPLMLKLSGGRGMNTASLRSCLSLSFLAPRTFGARENRPHRKIGRLVEHKIERKIDDEPNLQKPITVRFEEAGFHPEVGGQKKFEGMLTASVDGEPRGTPIVLKYTIEDIGGGRFRMRYSVKGKDGNELSDDKPIKFQATDGELDDDLAFEIKLASPGDFKSVKSIKIVKL